VIAEVLAFLSGEGFHDWNLRHPDLEAPGGGEYHSALEFRQRYLIAALRAGRGED